VVVVGVVVGVGVVGVMVGFVVVNVVVVIVVVDMTSATAGCTTKHGRQSIIVITT